MINLLPYVVLNCIRNLVQLNCIKPTLVWKTYVQKLQKIYQADIVHSSKFHLKAGTDQKLITPNEKYQQPLTKSV